MPALGRNGDEAGKGRRPYPTWYRIYFDAVQEGDRCKALLRIEQAQEAIRKRVEELRSSTPENGQELLDLSSAAIYLDILLQHIASESGDRLWD